MRKHQYLPVFWIPFFIGLMLSNSCRGYGNLQFKDDQGNTVDSVWDGRCYDSAAFPEGISWLLNDWDPNEVFDFNLSDFQSIANDSFETWEAVSDANVAFVFDGFTGNVPNGNGITHDLPPSPALDGDNVIGFDDLPTGVLGITYIFTLSDEFTFDDGDLDPNNDTDFGGTDANPDVPAGTYPAGTILDADIVLNKDFVDWSVTGEHQKYDLQSVLTHEIGHLLGLSHSMVRDNKQATMYPLMAPNPEGYWQCILQADDMAGIQTYYSENSSLLNSSIRGSLVNSNTGQPVAGGHVFLADPNYHEIVIGVYSDTNGSFAIQAVPPGNYLLRVEPLPFESGIVNEILMEYYTTDFFHQIHGSLYDESYAIPISVSAGQISSGFTFFCSPDTSQDTFEPDNDPVHAKTIPTQGQEQLRAVTDVDWIRFEAKQGCGYCIRTGHLTGDTILHLYDQDSTTLLSANDDGGAIGLDSFLLWYADRDGPYYVKIEPQLNVQGLYSLSVSENVNHRFVDGQSGMDSPEAGTSAFPWNSITYALNSVSADRAHPALIRVADNTYYENVLMCPYISIFGGFESDTFIQDNHSLPEINGQNMGSVITASAYGGIDRFRVTNGNGTWVSNWIYYNPGQIGGGINANVLGGIVITRSEICDNHIPITQEKQYRIGGGVCVQKNWGSALIGNYIHHNSASFGGGLYMGNAVVKNNLFRENTANRANDPHAFPGAGGGLFNNSGTMVEKNLFLGNIAYLGGGYAATTESGIFRHNILVGNYALDGGGAISFNALIGEAKEINDNIVIDNASLGNGGGIFVDGLEVDINNNIIAGNCAAGKGGGIYYSYLYAQINNNVIVGNVADYGGGLYTYNQFGKTQNNTIAFCQGRTLGGGIALDDKIGGWDQDFINNILAYNQAGGLTETTSENVRNILHNNFYENQPGNYYDKDTENWYELPEAVSTTALGNTNHSPLFYKTLNGISNSLQFDPNSYHSILYDQDVCWEPNSLAGLFINPDPNQPLHFYIIANTETTITTWGDITAVAGSGSQYQIFDYHLRPDSLNINSGMDVSAYLEVDIDGQARPLYGAFDIGADEVYPIAGDFEPDEDVDFVDLDFFFKHWLKMCAESEWCNDCDVNQDGVVDIADYGKIGAHWFKGAP